MDVIVAKNRTNDKGFAKITVIYSKEGEGRGEKTEEGRQK
jgi:hypothetical protein